MLDTILGKQRVIFGVVGLTILALLASFFLIMRSQATAQAVDWPPLTMIYEVSGPTVSGSEATGKKSVEVHRLDYQSRDQWEDEIIESEPLVTRVGSFTNTGSYQSLLGGEYTTYSSVTDDITTEKVEAGVHMIPRNNLSPFPIQTIEDAYNIRLTRIGTKSRVCFYNQCEENAEGLLLVDEGREMVFANDARGIPLITGSFIVREVRIHDERQEVKR